MTTAQFLAIIRAKILEATEDIVTDATILLYGNWVQQDIFKRSFPNDKILSATITFTAGVGTLPSGFGTMYGDAFKELGNYFPELSIDDFQKQTQNQGVTIEGGSIKVFPTTTASLTIKYWPTVPDMSVSVDTALNTYFQECLIPGTLAKVFEDLQDEQLADRYSVKYENMLNQKIANQSNYEEGNQRSGQMFSEQNLVGGTGIIF